MPLLCDDDGKRALYMVYEQTLMEMEEKGKIKGREEGRAEGRAEGREEVITEAAIDMLKEKLPVDMISRVTKLTVEQITEIGKKNALL